MFTVLHQKDGVETFHNAEKVTYHGPFAPMQQSDGYAVELVDGDVSRSLFGGTAYVMNEKGATVGRYILDHGAPGPDRFPLRNEGVRVA